MAIGDAAARTNPPNDDGAAPLPIVATENATETTDGGIDRSVHPSGIVPVLQCVYEYPCTDEIGIAVARICV